MLSLVVTMRLGSGRSSCRLPEGGRRKGERKRERERERDAHQSLLRFFREIAVGQPTKGISILNPIGGYAWPFHLFATGPKLVLFSPPEFVFLSLSLFLSPMIPRGGHRRTIRYDPTI